MALPRQSEEVTRRLPYEQYNLEEMCAPNVGLNSLAPLTQFNSRNKLMLSKAFLIIKSRTNIWKWLQIILKLQLTGTLTSFIADWESIIRGNAWGWNFWGLVQDIPVKVHHPEAHQKRGTEKKHERLMRQIKGFIHPPSNNRCPTGSWDVLDTYFWGSKGERQVILSLTMVNSISKLTMHDHWRMTSVKKNCWSSVSTKRS